MTNPEMEAPLPDEPTAHRSLSDRLDDAVSWLVGHDSQSAHDEDVEPEPDVLESEPVENDVAEREPVAADIVHPAEVDGDEPGSPEYLAADDAEDPSASATEDATHDEVHVAPAGAHDVDPVDEGWDDASVDDVEVEVSSDDEVVPESADEYADGPAPVVVDESEVAPVQPIALADHAAQVQPADESGVAPVQPSDEFSGPLAAALGAASVHLAHRRLSEGATVAEAAEPAFTDGALVAPVGAVNTDPADVETHVAEADAEPAVESAHVDRVVEAPADEIHAADGLAAADAHIGEVPAAADAHIGEVPAAADAAVGEGPAAVDDHIDDAPAAADPFSRPTGLYRDEVPVLGSVAAVGPQAWGTGAVAAGALAAGAVAGSAGAAVHGAEETRVLPATEDPAARVEERAARDRTLGKVETRADVPVPAPVLRPLPTTYNWLPSFALFLLRIVTAAILGIRALQHFQNLSATQDMIATTLIPEPLIAAWVLIGGEVAIALGLIFGVLSRVAGLGLAVLMGLALAFVQWGAINPFQAGRPGFIGELEVVLFAVGVLFLCVGGGRWAFDGGVHKGRVEKKNLRAYAG